MHHSDRFMPRECGRSSACRRHCEPTGPREARPDDRLRDLSAEALAKAEAIHRAASADMDCFVAPLLAITGRGCLTNRNRIK